MPVLAKIHCKTAGSRRVEILALCDRVLIGRVFKQQGKILDLKTYASFYNGEEVSEERALELLKKAENANVVGREAVELAKKAFSIDSKTVKKIAGTPCIQIYRI